MMYPDYAIRMTKDNLDKITPRNGGLRPATNNSAYFITTDDPEKHNLILTTSNFRRNFEFVEPEKDDDFTEVREK